MDKTTKTAFSEKGQLPYRNAGPLLTSQIQEQSIAGRCYLLCLNQAELARFVRPYYAKKDAMHDLSHVRRFLAVAQSLARKHNADKQVLAYAAYFHGIDKVKHGEDLMKFLASQGLPKAKAEKILHIASESHAESEPKTTEGKILHDAHLVAGGRELMVAKLLLTGALRGFPIEHTINYFEEEVDGRFRCYLPETRRAYTEMEKFAREFFHDLKASVS